MAMLDRVAKKELAIDEAAVWMRNLAFSDLGFARVDHHRELRQQSCEIVYAEGKTNDQIAAIVGKLIIHNVGSVIVTRADPRQIETVCRVATDAGLPVTVEPKARAVAIIRNAAEPKGRVLIVTAGTADLPVALEARLTSNAMGAAVDLESDVGVAGLHRLLAIQHKLVVADAIVVVAGMEGALASVVGGLVPCPVIACPTSVGYGASFGGLAALLSMLSSCAPGVVSVNIDDGVGAGYAAAVIARQSAGAREVA